jgi:hypothetical protein
MTTSSDAAEASPRRSDRLARSLTCVAYAASAVLFLAGLHALYEAEGPGRPEVQVVLSNRAGQSLFAQLALFLGLASISAAIASVGLYQQLYPRSRHWSLLGLLCTWLAAALLVGVMSVQYGVMSVGQEGIPASEISFHALTVFAHGVADLGGWLALGLLGFATLISSLLLWNTVRGKIPALVGFAICVLLVFLYNAGASFFFMLPFAAWEIVMCVHLMTAPAGAIRLAPTEHTR